MLEIFGITISTQELFFLFIIFIGILMIVFFRNRKYNLYTIKLIGKELEAALQPKDQTYTWLGGSVGFNAEYKTDRPLRKVNATVTMLSRQSLLFFPISKLLLGNDRLFVVLHPFEKFRREAHILEHWYYKLRMRTLENESSLRQTTLALNGKTFHIFSSDTAGVEKLSAWLKGFPDPTLIKHVALTPHNGTIYLYMVPKLTTVTQSVQALIKLAGK